MRVQQDPELINRQCDATRADDPKTGSRHPSLYQINTRVLLRDLQKELGREATLADVPDALLNRLSDLNFDWIWFLGVWQTGPRGRRISRENPEWQQEFHDVLSDFSDEDVCGSCFAVTGYRVNAEFGGNAALIKLRERIHARGMKLLLDFVPNHTALDHPWVQLHPEFYVHGTEADLEREPQNYIILPVEGKPTILAYGRDPYFAGWPDTLQLNYAEAGLQAAMRQELTKVVDLCDGVRCDMAMLILPEVFERTWGRRPAPFWPEAIQYVRSRNQDFLFMAEVYWDLEWTLQQQGFTYTYDKRLYDRLREGHARPVREHFWADMDFQMRSARFLENHDEPRAAATFAPDQHRAAAVLTFFCPGLRFFHDGQFEGRTKKVPVHLGRRPDEKVDAELQEFYGHLLASLKTPATRNGSWRLLQCDPAWEGNWTADCFIGFAWESSSGERLIAVANYAPNQSQCYLRIPFANPVEQSLVFQDLMSHVTYERNGSDLMACGLYLDLPGWGYHVFRVTSM